VRDRSGSQLGDLRGSSRNRGACGCVHHDVTAREETQQRRRVDGRLLLGLGQHERGRRCLIPAYHEGR
jgi:hypothetical protein